MRLRTRMALISAAAVAVVVVLAVVLAQQVARRELMREIDESLVQRAEDIERFPLGALEIFTGEAASGGERGFRRFGPESLFGRSDRGFDALYFQWLAPNGEVYPAANQPLSLPVSPQDSELAMRAEGDQVSGKTRLIRTVEADGERLRMITAPLPSGAIQIGRSLEEVDETLVGVTGTLTIAGAIGVALAALLGLVVARSALRPVDALTETVEHVAKTQELAARIEVDRDDEIGRLAKSFNAMLEALDESRVQQQRLVRDAGHELRTPLTALRTNIELLARAKTLDDAQRTELLDAATSELRELSDLTAELVELAADAAAVTEPPQTERIDELAERVAERFRRRTGRDIVLGSEPFTATVSVTALERAISNLVDNAHKWSPPGAAIHVDVRPGRVAVSDEGPGIRAEDQARVFDRFYRSDEARTTPGSGLGLAIVKKVVDELGGEVFVDANGEKGATVGFTLPTV